MNYALKQQLDQTKETKTRSNGEMDWNPFSQDKLHLKINSLEPTLPIIIITLTILFGKVKGKNFISALILRTFLMDSFCYVK